MSDPTPTEPKRPEILKGTPTLTPWWRRPSNGALLLAGVMAVASEFPRFAEQILPFVREDWKSGLRLAAYGCTFLAVVLVRLGVTRTDEKTEKLAARTEERLAPTEPQTPPIHPELRLPLLPPKEIDG